MWKQILRLYLKLQAKPALFELFEKSKAFWQLVTSFVHIVLVDTESIRPKILHLCVMSKMPQSSIKIASDWIRYINASDLRFKARLPSTIRERFITDSSSPFQKSCSTIGHVHSNVKSAFKRILR
jgi:hypothetical protein